MEKFEIDGKKFTGYTIPTPKASLLAIRSKYGMLACGYLNLDTADKMGDTLAIVRGVNSYDDMRAREVSGVSAAAKALGVEIGMTGEQALLKMS